MKSFITLILGQIVRVDFRRILSSRYRESRPGQRRHHRQVRAAQKIVTDDVLRRDDAPPLQPEASRR